MSDTQRLKALEEENSKLKWLLADAMLDNMALKNLLKKRGDARGSTLSRGASADGLRDERMGGVPRDRGRPDLDPVCAQTCR